MTNFTLNSLAKNTETPANTRVISTVNNSKGYSSFNIYLVPVYTNDQLHYYHTTKALLDIDKIRFRNQMKKCKNILELIN